MAFDPFHGVFREKRRRDHRIKIGVYDHEKWYYQSLQQPNPHYLQNRAYFQFLFFEQGQQEHPKVVEIDSIHEVEKLLFWHLFFPYYQSNELEIPSCCCEP